MKMKTTVVVTALVLWAATTSHRIAAQTQSSEVSIATQAPIVIPTAEIKWVQVRPGQETSVLWGDPRTGPYGRFNKFAGGFDDRPHYHTRDLRSVVISGVLIVQVLGGERRELESASYSFLPGRTPHTHSCKTGADCVLFVQQDGPNDTVPVEAAR